MGALCHGISGFGVTKCKLGGISSACRAKTTLINAATPAAPERWPILVLTEPNSSGTVRSGQSTLSSACTSIGSPNTVPVPWVSTYWICAGCTRAFSRAWRNMASWARPLGAVRPLLAPSWLTAEPRITPKMRSPALTASASRFKTTMPAPSPIPKPSASAAKVLQRPSGATAPIWERPINCSGASTRFTPPANARLHSPVRSAWQAKWTANSEEEQAVSSCIAGPCRPRT